MHRAPQHTASEHPATGSTATDLETGDRRSPNWIVRLVVLVALFATLVMVGSIGYRWYHVRFPDTAIYVRAESGNDGARLTVSSENGQTIYQGTLARSSGSRAAVLVEEGYYRILIEQDGQPLVKEQVYVPQGGITMWVRAPAAQTSEQPDGGDNSDAPQTPTTEPT